VAGRSDSGLPGLPARGGAGRVLRVLWVGTEGAAMTEYRIEELAAAAETTVRSLQSYRNKGLLPPPRRQGRIALYSDDHLERVRLIASLIERGYSLNAINELLSGLNRGEDISDLLGVQAAVAAPKVDEPVVVIARRDMDPVFGPLDDAQVRAAEQLGVVRRCGAEAADPLDQQYEVVNAVLLEAGAALIAAGIPLDALLEEALVVQQEMDQIAHRFVRLIVDNLFDGTTPASAATATSLTELVAQVRPLAETVVTANLGPAIERHVHDDLASRLDRLLRADPVTADAP
jgi:DNA-binding transcriptional MerR regulator